MVTGWRRAFCTSIPKQDQDSKLFPDKHQQKQKHKTQSKTNDSSSSPRISSKFRFLSAPSTPRIQTQSQLPVSSPKLRCRTAVAASASVPSSPKLHCKTASAANSPRLFHLSSSSNPNSPKSPSSFSLLRATLRVSKTRCGICLLSAKAGQGTAIFTAECSHTFHFPCIAAHVKKNRVLVCPICSVAWKELPLLDDSTDAPNDQTRPKLGPKDSKLSPNSKPLRVYDDDESLLSPNSVSRFNPIPESDESNEDEPVEFQGFFVGSVSTPASPSLNLNPPRNNLEVRFLPEAALVSVNKSYGTYAVVLKVKAPPPLATGIGSPPRAPVDLVTVLDVSAGMTGDKLQLMKRAMRLVISSLSDTDRLSIVAFSATSKRLLPLRRMTITGRRSARRIVDAIGCTVLPGSVNDALRKAAKVLEDRREKNPVATIMLLSNGHDKRIHPSWKRSYPVVTTTRIGDFPVHAVGFGDGGSSAQEEAFGKSLTGLLSVAVQDLKLQLGFVPGSYPAEITAVYSLIGRPSALGSGSGSFQVGDLYADEERELLVELKVASGSGHVMSVGSLYKDPPTQELVYSKEHPLPVPRPQAVRSPSIQRLKNLHVTARAIAESRRQVERGDLKGAYHLLSTARALLVQSGLGSGDEFLRCLGAELTELQRARQAAGAERRESILAEEKPEPLTPTSAWRAAERLAKVAIMRKSMNRVSDLHGFEDARF